MALDDVTHDDSGPADAELGQRPRLRQIADARTMRALTHPVRIALLEALSLGGAMTATEVGERIGESPTTCSFHLRQLAKYGWVEEAGGGKGRARPWRMTATGFRIASTHDDPDTDIAATTLNRMIRERQLARYETWIKTRGSYPRRWQDAVSDSEYLFYLTPDELREVNESLHAALMPWLNERRRTDPAQRPPGSLPVEVLTFGYPIEPPNTATAGTPGEEGAE